MKQWTLYNIKDCYKNIFSTKFMDWNICFDAIFEASLLCLLYTINVILNFEYITPFMILSENALLIFCYFGARCFLPNVDFRFRLTSVFALSVFVAIPALMCVHTFFEVVCTVVSMLFASLIVGVISSVLEGDDRASAFIVTYGGVSDEILSVLNNEFNIFSIVDVSRRVNCKRYHCFSSLRSIKRFFEILRRFSIFRLPTTVIYIDDEYNIEHFSEVYEFAKLFDLHVVDKLGNKFTIDHFLQKSTLSDGEQIMLDDMFRRRKVIIEYNGNSVLLELIKRLSANKYTEIIVVCSCPKLISDIECTENTSITVSQLYNVIQSSSNVDYVFASSNKVLDTDLFELKKHSSVSNAIQYLNIIDVCDERRVKYLYLISQLDQSETSTLNSFSQRIAELAVQTTCNAIKDYFTKIIPVRVQETFADAVESNFLPEGRYAWSHDMCDSLMRLIIDIGEQKCVQKMYYIDAKPNVTFCDYINLLSLLDKRSIRNCKSKAYSSMKCKMFEALAATSIPNIFVDTSDVCMCCGIDDLESILDSKTEKEFIEKLQLYITDNSYNNFMGS